MVAKATNPKTTSGATVTIETTREAIVDGMTKPVGTALAEIKLANDCNLIQLFNLLNGGMAGPVDANFGAVL
ncbi:MAG: hypothetical protein AB7N71_13300 [Phycisphaerae bacterium]